MVTAENTPGEARTHNLSLRRRLLYPVELRARRGILLGWPVQGKGNVEVVAKSDDMLHSLVRAFWGAQSEIVNI